MTYDFHIHSCLSPCGGRDMTPFNIANFAAMAGYDAIAVADHNSAGNCRVVMRAAEEAGIIALPALELTTAEEVHVLCLFETPDGAEQFASEVYSTLPDFPVDTRVYNEQLLMDDEPCGKLDKLLTSASGVGVYDAAQRVREFGGLALLAHADAPSFSLTSNLGFYDPAMGYEAVELTRRCDRTAFRAANPQMKGLPWITDSDAHALETLPDPEFYLECEDMTPRGILKAIRSSVHTL